jgi:hypothetical protein
MFDVFYSGKKPGVVAHERQADSIEHAQQLSSTRYFWWINYLYDYSDWDWLFEPLPWQSEYTHVWPSQWDQVFGAYLVPTHATELNYFHHRDLVPTRVFSENFNILIDCEFDQTWVPHPWEPPHVYVWGNQHWDGTIMPTVKYTVPGATEVKFMDWPVPQLTACRHNWKVLEGINEQSWDWTWKPNPTEPPYIYVWGNQWNPSEFKASLEYHVSGATERKYMDQRTQRLPDYGNQWHVLLNIEEFDYSWEPNPFDPPYIYVFGNQWYSAEVEPTVEYHVPGATERKYVHDIVARVQPNTTHYHQHCAVESFDYSWHPDPGEPAYIYVFGNQWHAAEIMPTVEYHVPGATERKYMSAPCAQLPECHTNHWHTIEDCDWDYSWVPDPGDPAYIYVFGNQWHSAEIMPTVAYTVPGATERKYMDMPRAVLPQDPNRPWYNVVPDCDWDYSWVPDPGEPPYIYVFGNQHWPAEKMPTIEYRVSGATERKYMNYPCAELLPDVTHWTIPVGVDAKSVDLSWVPDPGEPPYIYQFATQHQKTGGPVYTVPGATETKYLEHVQVPIQYTTVPVVEINHSDGAQGHIPNTIKTIRYFDNYRDTLIRLAKSLVGEHEWVWVCSSICDYTNFDFSWHPERWQTTMLHVFASDDQKFGDTFYMHVPTFAERAEKKQLLEWYSVNYVPRVVVPRRPIPVIAHVTDSHVNAVLTESWAGPLALFTANSIPITVPAVNLWREQTKTIVPLDAAASSIIVPRSAKTYIKTQLYDYPYINKQFRNMIPAPAQDIVFISYDEPEADRNWEILHKKFPNSKRVHGVAGMEKALEAGADASSTPWYWAVFAKTEIAPGFDFAFVPDYMQQPKHYIFNCFNTVNSLEYGHMGMVLYNCRGVRDTNRAGNFGLDYTLSFPNESIPILSCLGRFNTTPYHTWRTAFRETAKLAFFESQQNTVDGQYRLTTWLNQAHGEHAEWCLKGAHDGLEFFKFTGGNLSKLKQSFKWEWLRNHFEQRYGDLQ